MTADLVLYLVQLVAGAGYAAVLELVFHRRYEPGYTWVTVVWGTGQVGLLVAVRLLLAPVPPLTGSSLAWYLWWMWAYSFGASGLPIIVWQVVLQDRRWKRVQQLWEQWQR